MNPKPAELQTRRGRFFFLIGLVILPIFWIWWMRPAYFSQWQRRAGWVWTVGYVVALILCKDLVGERLQAVMFSYATVSLQLGAALWLWLLFRVFSVVEGVVVYVIAGEVLIGYSRYLVPALSWLAASPAVFIFPLIPAVFHLVVDPVRRWRGGWNLVP